MGKIQSYRDLVAWQKAMHLVMEVYRATKGFPKDEIFGLSIQLRRAAVSIPSNIAEGQAKRSTGEFKLFLGHAKGSLAELETQLLIAHGLAYLDEPETSSLLGLAAEVGRLLNGLLAALKGKRQAGLKN